MYLWCSRCLHAALETSWRRLDTKYGICPKCGSSEHNNALPWESVAAANDYPSIPSESTAYPLHPVLF